MRIKPAPNPHTADPTAQRELSGQNIHNRWIHERSSRIFHMLAALHLSANASDTKLVHRPENVPQQYVGL